MSMTVGGICISQKNTENYIELIKIVWIGWASSIFIPFWVNLSPTKVPVGKWGQTRPVLSPGVGRSALQATVLSPVWSAACRGTDIDFKLAVKKALHVIPR